MKIANDVGSHRTAVKAPQWSRSSGGCCSFLVAGRRNIRAERGVDQVVAQYFSVKSGQTTVFTAYLWGFWGVEKTRNCGGALPGVEGS